MTLCAINCLAMRHFSEFLLRYFQTSFEYFMFVMERQATTRIPFFSRLLNIRTLNCNALNASKILRSFDVPMLGNSLREFYICHFYVIQMCSALRDYYRTRGSIETFALQANYYSTD